MSSIEIRIARYLDGDLDAQATAEIEAALVDSEVAALLSEELMLRALLGELPPHQPPESVIERLEQVLELSARSWTDRLREVVRIAIVTPGRKIGATAISSIRPGLAGARAASRGASTVRASVARIRRRPVGPPRWGWMVVTRLWRRQSA